MDIDAFVVAAAGNAVRSNGLFRFYPVRHPGVLTMGAMAKNARTRTGFSSAILHNPLTLALSRPSKSPGRCID